MDSDKAIPKALIPPKVLKGARKSHLRSLQDGKMRWWEFDGLEDDDVLNELMEIAEPAVNIDESEHVY
jgi:hypothetical protein